MKKYLVALFFILVDCPFVLAQHEVSNSGYRGYVDCVMGGSYNLNTDQLISINNMQWYTMLSTTHGCHQKNWFVGAGVGYFHSCRDNENMYPLYVAGRYTFENNKIDPFLELRAGIVYDPQWIEKVQKYSAFSAGIKVHNRIQAGLRVSIFSRPSRFFTANAAVVLSYDFGRR